MAQQRIGPTPDPNIYIYTLRARSTGSTSCFSCDGAAEVLRMASILMVIDRPTFVEQQQHDQARSDA